MKLYVVLSIITGSPRPATGTVFELDGVVIAEVVQDHAWTQVGGAPLGKELLENICNQIEAHYD